MKIELQDKVLVKKTRETATVMVVTIGGYILKKVSGEVVFLLDSEVELKEKHLSIKAQKIINDIIQEGWINNLPVSVVLHKLGSATGYSRKQVQRVFVNNVFSCRP